MQDNSRELIRISRLLTPEYQEDLYNLVKLAYKAENSVKKSLGFEIESDDVSFQTQDFFCEKKVKRSKI